MHRHQGRLGLLAQSHSTWLVSETDWWSILFTSQQVVLYIGYNYLPLISSKSRPTIWKLASHRNAFAIGAMVRTGMVAQFVQNSGMWLSKFFSFSLPIEGVGESNWTISVEIGRRWGNTLQKPFCTTSSDPGMPWTETYPTGLLPHIPFGLWSRCCSFLHSSAMLLGPLWGWESPRCPFGNCFPKVWFLVQVKPSDDFNWWVHETISGNGRVPWLHFSLYTPNPKSIYWLPKWASYELRMNYFMPRSGNLFPTTHGGKAFDTALLMAWLSDEMAAGSKARSVQMCDCTCIYCIWYYNMNGPRVPKVPTKISELVGFLNCWAMQKSWWCYAIHGPSNPSGWSWEPAFPAMQVHGQLHKWVLQSHQDFWVFPSRRRVCHVW